MGDVKADHIPVSTEDVDDEDDNQHNHDSVDYDELTWREKCQFMGPAIKSRWKTILVAILLLVAGLTFLGLSIFFFVTHKLTQGITFVILSAITILPGGWAVLVVLWTIFKAGDPDDLDELPSYE